MTTAGSFKLNLRHFNAHKCQVSIKQAGFTARGGRFRADGRRKVLTRQV